MDSIDVITVEAPNVGLNETYLEIYKEGEPPAQRTWAKSPIPIDRDLNSRVILYDGDIELLSAEAIVNPTNESLSQLDYVAKMAGPELQEFIRKKVRMCQTGEVRLTSGFRSNYKYIIHAVPPKYQPKYKSAAETSLFHTYFRVFERLIEHNIRTVVMPTLATNKCDYPLEENCELHLRIIRRILEKKRKQFDRIVVHTNDFDTYAPTFFSYFPRTPIDQEVACYHLPPSLGGPNGEPVIPEREIRIKSKPTVLDPHDISIDLTTGLDLSTVVGKTAFSKMREDLESHGVPNKKQPGARGGVQPNQQLSLAGRQSVFKGCNLF